MEKVFLIPKFNEFAPRPDFVNLLLEAIQYSQWLGYGKEYRVVSANLEDMTSEQSQEFKDTRNMVFPVGNLEFTNRVFALQGYAPIRPINLPEELRIPEFTGRKVACANTTEQAKQIAESFLPAGQSFVKSMTRIKAKENGMYLPGDFWLLPEDKWQVSEKIPDLEEEYRVIVFHQKILHIAKYAGESLVGTYDIDFIEKCIRSWKGAPPAYTLDIGVCANGKSLVIEAHNFLSCGLYGFERAEKMIPMTVQAIQYEHKIQK